VPYAAPPVGDRRWRPPAPAEPWPGVRDAAKDGPTAIQRGAEIEDFLHALLDGHGWSERRVKVLMKLYEKAPAPRQSEDCLYLTVRTPSPDPSARLPVMVWIHGGDHQDGAGTEIFYASNALARHGVVTVSINYRLGVMGFFAHPELAAESPHGVAGNYGMLDQIAALEWVRDNIANFGGDPDNVTIFGESAGGESVMHLMTSPLARGLFHRAIPQSPANSGQLIHLDRPFLAYDSALDMGGQFAAKLGVTGGDQLARLRAMSAEQISEVARPDQVLGTQYPVIDGHVLPESPLAAFAAGRQAPVPMMIGSNSDEGSVLHALVDATMAEYAHLPLEPDALQPEVAAAFGDDFDRLLELYPGLDRREHGAESDFLGDHLFGGRVFHYARHHHAAGHPTYLYFFTRHPKGDGQTVGAYHAAELAFVHGSRLPILPMTKDDKALSAEMMRYWTDFARGGHPNGAAATATHPYWPRFDPTRPYWMRLDHRIEYVPIDRLDKYEVLNARTDRVVAAMSALATG
jgi:para-nitrobenzyl esterase